MNRAQSLERLADPATTWDVLVIGGGATGLGVAVDAAARGYRTALVEQHDFAKGTLRERGLMARNAPHLVQKRGFVIPVYRRLDLPLYGFGLKAYERLSGQLSFGASRRLTVAETQRLLPTVQTDGLRGGVRYYDGQFDDARLALTLARTAHDLGAAVVNYARVERLLKDGEHLAGAEITDQETGRRLTVRARVVVNATGIFTDELRRLDDAQVAPMLSVSSGVHLTLARAFLPGEHALMIPRTTDGRVLFAVPWQDHVFLGTTDEPRDGPELEPRPLEREIEFLLENANTYLAKPVTRADVLSVVTGLRPLVRRGQAAATKSLSRDHVIAVSPGGLVTITGGKWTSYRKMAEDAVTRAAEVGGLSPRDAKTQTLRLHGTPAARVGAAARRFAHYGTDAAALEILIEREPALGKEFHPRLALCGAEVVWAASREMARTLDDMLARRCRALQLDARAALDVAVPVATLLARELGRDQAWITAQVAEFRQTASGYLPKAKSPAKSR